MCEFCTASDERIRPGNEASDSQAGLSGTMFDVFLYQPLHITASKPFISDITVKHLRVLKDCAWPFSVASLSPF